MGKVVELEKEARSKKTNRKQKRIEKAVSGITLAQVFPPITLSSKYAVWILLSSKELREEGYRK